MTINFGNTKGVKIMKLEETAKYLKRGENMSRTIKNNSRPPGGICEQFGYLPKLVVCTNNSGMNELCTIKEVGKDGI